MSGFSEVVTPMQHNRMEGGELKEKGPVQINWTGLLSETGA